MCMYLTKTSNYENVHQIINHMFGHCSLVNNISLGVVVIPM